jgi:hypothetical protein
LDHQVFDFHYLFLFYNGGDCWIAGTWYHGDNGVDLFVPGSAATQYLMNICGWGNVA